MCSRYFNKALQTLISPTLVCNQIDMGLAMKNVMNRTTKTTVNGYIRDGGRGGGGGWRHFQRQGDRNTTEEGGRGRNYDNCGIDVRRKILLKGGVRRGGGYNDTPNSLIYLINLVVFSNGGKGAALGDRWP